MSRIPRRWLVMAAAALLLGLASSAPTWASTVQVTVDGQGMNFDQPPVVTGGHVLVPLRGIFERLGAQVEFSAASRTIVATRTGTTIQLTLGSNQAMVNGNRVLLETAAQEVNGRTLVPLRFVSEAMGAQVRWNAAQRMVAITSTSLPPSATINPPSPPGNPVPTISGVYHDGRKGMRPGDIVRVEADGTPGAFATFDLLGISNGNAMSETSRGHYAGTVTITPQMSPGQSTTVVVHLAQNGLTVARQSTSNFTLAAATSEGATLESVDVRANGPVQVGQGIRVTARGTAGGYATMDVGQRRGLPMTEVQPGRYRATHTITGYDDPDSRVQVHLRLPDGTRTSRDSSRTLAQSYLNDGGSGNRPVPGQANLFVTVDSPRAGERTQSDFTVTGSTQPFATVTVNVVVRQALLPGVVDINHQTVNAQVQADRNGRYAVPIHVRSASNRTTAVVNVTARNQNGQTSQPVEFDIATGP